jgi:heme-binding protein/cytochrome P460
MIVRTAAGLALLFLLLQLVRPALTNPPATADFEAPSDVKQILRKSCYACHSNETRLSWFDEIVPAYQLVARDVKRGRMVLNFSELGAQPKAHQHAVLFEAVSQIQMGAMPLSRYTRLHPEAVVTPSELAALRDYILPASPARPAAQPDIEAADAQYRHWIAAASMSLSVQSAPNGSAFLPDYKNWKAISSTDRSDTNTLKMILGNDVAIRAIAANNINPWPNGTAFAKVSWMRQADDNGVIRTGKFEQVAFMIKDSGKYASTAGWGWAQWMGAELKPFGSDADFARECVACHAPLRKNDYVFTAPIAAARGPL